MKKKIAAAVLFGGLLSTPLALSHLDGDWFQLSYRQSVMAVVGANFAPMSAMIKGDMPWDQQAFEGFAEGLALAGQLDVVRGFAPDTQGGKTKAKPRLWNNLDDFQLRWKKMAEEGAKLADVATSGDKQAIVAQFKETGGTCKGCHDEYKSKEYLN